jgi:hypothetical protein
MDDNIDMFTSTGNGQRIMDNGQCRKNYIFCAVACFDKSVKGGWWGGVSVQYVQQNSIRTRKTGKNSSTQQA